MTVYDRRIRTGSYIKGATEERRMRNDQARHSPVSTQPLSESRIAWLGPVEAARQQALLRVNGGVKADRRDADRRRGDRREQAAG